MKIYDEEDLKEGKVLPIYINVNNKELLEGYARLIEYCSNGLSQMIDGDEDNLYVKQRWLVEFIEVDDKDEYNNKNYITQTNLKGFRTHRFFTYKVGRFNDLWRQFSGEENASSTEREFIDADNYDGFF